jgi:uncharacterized protein (TIGR04255 family)
MEKKIFAKNYLTEVILRVDFNNLISLTTEMIKDLHNALPFEKKEYKENTVKGYELKFGDESEPLKITQKGKSGTFTINDPPTPIKFIIDHEKFALTSSKYERFDSFYEYFKKGFETFLRIQRVTEFKRIGLRYVNVFSLGDEIIKEISGWKEFINSAYIPNYQDIKVEETEFTLRRNMTSFILGDGEMFVNIQLGIWNNSFPGKIVDKEFVLDIDCFIDNRILTDSEVLEVVKSMNKKAYFVFYSLTTPRLRSLMEAK